MITDLVQIRRLGEQKFDENHRFRTYLKTHNFVERRFRKIAGEIEDQIDCTQCANCCRVALTPIAERDVEKLARFLRLSLRKFLEQYTKRDEFNDLVLETNQNGCVFLEGNLCTVYEARPGTCERYPHLVRGQGSLVSRMWQFVDRASYCPIDYNTMEASKDHVGWPRR